MDYNNLYCYSCLAPFRINGINSIFTNNILKFTDSNIVINNTSKKSFKLTTQEKMWLFNCCKKIEFVPKKYLNKNMNLCEDKINHPSHYTWLKEKCGIEVLDIARHLDFNLGNSIKYILRAGHKSEEGMNIEEKKIEDLKKAIFYLNDEIKLLEK